MTLDDLHELVAIDIAAAGETLEHLADCRRRVGTCVPTVHEMAALALSVRDVHHGLGNVMVRLVKCHSVDRPDGTDWHNALSRMFADPPAGVLPTLITSDLGDRMSDLRAFRHVRQRRYAADVAWQKLEPLLAQVASTFAAFRSNVAADLRRLAGEPT